MGAKSKERYKRRIGYLYGLTEAYDIDKARRRSRYFEDQSERDLWKANEILKNEIDKWSYSGHTEASIDIDFPTYGEPGTQVITADLVDMYAEAGYKVRTQSLSNTIDNSTAGFRVTVSWEE